MKKAFKLFAFAAAIVVAMVSCQKPAEEQKPDDKTPATVALKGISLNKTSAELAIGATETLTVAYDPADATEKPEVEWSTSKAEVATVAKGVVTAVAAGEATITAKAGEFTATCKVTVKEGEQPQPKGLITIDGDFTDWLAADVDIVENGNHTVMMAMDENNLYIYSERTFDDAFPWGGSEAYIYFALDTDKNPETGSETLWGNGPFEYVGVIWPYGGTASAPAITKNPSGNYGSDGKSLTGVECAGDIDEDVVAIEFSVPLSGLCAIPTTPFIIYSWGSPTLSKVEYHIGEAQPEPEPDEPDWEEVPSVTNGNHTFQFTTDAKYAWFRTQRERDSRFDEEWKDSDPGYIYFCFDTDGDPTTGVTLNGVGPWEYVAYIFPFSGTAEEPVFAIRKAGGVLPAEYSLDNIAVDGSVDEDGLEVVYRLPLADLPALPEKYTVYTKGNKGLAAVEYPVPAEGEDPGDDAFTTTDFAEIADDAELEFEGIVTLFIKNGFIMTDGETNIYVFKPAANTAVVGDKVKVKAKKTTYYNFIEAKEGATVEVLSSNNEAPWPAASDITESFDDFPDDVHTSEIVFVKGKIVVDGNNINVEVPGAEDRTGSIRNTDADELADIKALDGKDVKIMAYYAGTGGSGGIYVYLGVLYAEEIGDEPADVEVIIDGEFEEWEDVPGFESTSSTVKEWKFASDEENIYLYFKIVRSDVVSADNEDPAGSGLYPYNWRRYCTFMFDTDNNEATGENKTYKDLHLAGAEAWGLFYPFRGNATGPKATDGNPSVVNGVESQGGVVAPTTDKVTVFGVVEEDFAYLEAVIARSSIGSPASGQMKVQVGLSYNNPEPQVVTLK